MPESAKNTAYVLRSFNQLFDTLYGKELMTDTSNHVKILTEAKGVLNRMHFVNKVNPNRAESVPFLKNLIFTIDSVLRTWKVLKSLGFKSLDARRLNQDPLENHCGRVRSQGLKNHRPTPLQFKQIAKSLLIDNLTSDHSPGANCAADDDKFIFSWAEYENQAVKEKPDLSIPTNVKEHIFRVQSDSTASMRKASKSLTAVIRKSNCELCKSIFEENLGRLVESLVNDTRPVLINLIAKIFTLNNVEERARNFLKREINFVVFSSKQHKEFLINTFLNSVIQEYLNLVIGFVNRILVGKLFINHH